MKKTSSEMSDYWKLNSLEWEAGAYQDDNLSNKVGCLDRLSSMFRGNSTERRMSLALEYLKPHIKGKTILDIGCASGTFAVQLLQAGAKQVIGYDVSEDSIAYAESKRKVQYPDQLEFRVVDVLSPENSLPEVDFATALGVLEYFTLQEVELFLEKLNVDFFLFHCADVPSSFSGRIRLLLRRVYLHFKGCPAVNFHDFQKIKTLSESKGFTNIRKIDDTCFVTNIL